MNSQSVKLASLNPTFEFNDGYYSAPRTNAVKVEFTNAEQEQIAGVLSGLDDGRSFSAEFETKLGDESYLSVLRPQTMLAFDFSGINTVLEISQDYGNVCRFLAENNEAVDCIKIDKNAARATAYRCADLANVGIVQGRPTSLTMPVGYYDLIVLSDVELLTDNHAEIAALLASLSNALTEQGLLLLNYQNTKPLSVWFNNKQAMPYAGLYGTLQNRLTSLQWLSLLQQCNLSSISEHCFLPNSDRPRTILAKSYIESNPAAVNHFYGAGLVSDAAVNEYLLFTELAKTRDLYELCDSYLLIAGQSAEPIKSFYNNDFLHFSSPGRRRRWRTLTSKQAGSAHVNKQRLFDNDADISQARTDSGINLKQDIAPQSYQHGQSLAGLWLQCLVHQPDSNQFVQYIKDYYAWLAENQAQFGGALYDILPFNLIVSADDAYQVIDPEWDVDSIITPEFVLFRALFWFGFHNRVLLRQVASQNGLFSLQDFVDFGLKLVGYRGKLTAFAQTETQIQSAIEKQFNQDAIEQTLRLPIAGQATDDHPVVQPKAQVFWYDPNQAVDFANSVTVATQKIGVIETLDFSISKLNTSVKMLRIDPVDRGGFFRVCDIQIFNHQGDVLWSIASERLIAASAELQNVVFAESHLGSVFLAQNDDPQLIFDLTAINGLAEAAKLTLQLTYYRGIDYILVMQQLGQDALLQQQFIVSQRNELETLKARYSELGDHFEFLKNNSEKQNKLIEGLMECITHAQHRIDEQEQHAEDQEQVIQTQLEMMNRSKIKRLKLLFARLIGNVDEQSEATKAVKPIARVSAKAHILGQNNEDYALWIKKQQLNKFDRQRILQEIDAMPLQPVFSIVVPVYNIDEEYLMLAVNSVRNQLYPYWELCLVDDASPDYHIRPMLKRLAALDDRIVVKLNKHNQGIAGASNDAVQLTTGDYVGLLDHDDEISIDALYENAKVINQYPDVGFIYSDEDKITLDERRVDPFFKPDYSPDLLDSQNYICHFSVISQDVVNNIGGFRLGFDGSQDHDIIIRAIQQSQRVVHIPKVLYHWRKVPGSTAEVYDAKSYAWEAGRKAVQARLAQSGEKGDVLLGPLQGTFQVKRDIIGEPKVSIIIPFKDKAALLRTCLHSIFEKSTYSNFEIIGVSNNSEQPETQDLMAAMAAQHNNVRFVEKNQPFNFSSLCNYGVAQSSGDFILLLNNDIKIISEDWLERLLEHAQRKQVGAVGGKLFFPDGRIQHAGIVFGMHGAAGHSHLYFSPTDIGYYGSLMVTRNVAAVTGAMLMVSREKYDLVDGLDEQNLAVAYNDVDLCLKLVAAGHTNIFTPFCQATHHESASRGYEDNPEKMARLERERDYFLDKWSAMLQQGDPCFNPNFDLNQHDYSIQV